MYCFYFGHRAITLIHNQCCREQYRISHVTQLELSQPKKEEEKKNSLDVIKIAQGHGFQSCIQLYETRDGLDCDRLLFKKLWAKGTQSLIYTFESDLSTMFSSYRFRMQNYGYKFSCTNSILLLY